MNKVILTCVPFVSLILAGMSAQAETLVFLLGGQSNMAGLGAYAGQPPEAGYGPDLPCPAPYSAPQPAVKFWNYGPNPQPDPVYGINIPGTGTGWVDLQTGFGHMPGEFGPEVSFGYALHNLYPNDQIYLVKEGVTSQNLAVRWNPDGTGGIYNTFKGRVDAALQNLTAAGLTPKIAGMIWMQGQGDCVISYVSNKTSSRYSSLQAARRRLFLTPTFSV